MFILEESAPRLWEFEFGGEVYGIPAVDSLPLSTYRRIRRAIGEAGDKADDAFFDEVMRLFDEYAPEVVDKLDLEQAKALFVAYSTNDDGAGLGESSASSD